MKDILKSKLILAPFIVIALFPLAFFGIFGIPLIISTINNLETGKTNDTTGVFIPILSLLLIIFLLIRLLNRFPRFTIDRDGIKFSTIFNSTKHDWNDIENIELTGKKEFWKFYYSPSETTTFNFKNGEIKHLWIEQYSNSSEIRIVLERAKQILIDKSSTFNNLYFEIYNPPNQIESIKLEKGEIFNDNHLFSLTGILFYGFLASPLYFIYIYRIPSKVNMIAPYIILSFVFLILGGLISFGINYFILTDKFLVVKNSIWFWKNKIHRIEDIKEIVIDTPQRSTICLRIINNNYKTNVYSASSLRTKTWEKLISHLEQKNITVRDEAINLR
jgi:hypothetical protein